MGTSRRWALSVISAAIFDPEGPGRGGLLDFCAMFMSRKHITGSHDRGAWPWRRHAG